MGAEAEGVQLVSSTGVAGVIAVLYLMNPPSGGMSNKNDTISGSLQQTQTQTQSGQSQETEHQPEPQTSTSGAGSKKGGPFQPTRDNINRMQARKPPIGQDGNSVELHHKGQKQNSQLQEMTRTDHRGKGNFKKNHPNTGQQKSQINRSQFNKQSGPRSKDVIESLEQSTQRKLAPQT